MKKRRRRSNCCTLPANGRICSSSIGISELDNNGRRTTTRRRTTKAGKSEIADKPEYPQTIVNQ
nr:uncharacterized protein LOC108054535 isoform X1 [Drosophila takahashii]